MVASGQCLLPRGDCGGLPGQRGEGTISLLCLGGWGGTQAGDVTVALDGGRDLSHSTRSGSSVSCFQTERTCFHCALVLLGQLEDCVGRTVFIFLFPSAA